MGSIVLSFVGSQDPYSEKNNQEGSIVTLVRHLIKEEKSIKKIFLLYTSGTQPQAELTKEWLNSEVEIELDKIDIFPVSQEFSNDPIDLSLAIGEARRCLSKAVDYRNKKDTIEFNATSGTPVMKMAWGILSALGYASKSRIWQVRNPLEIKLEQERVFFNSVNVLKNELDLKLIKNQLHHYNYAGAIQTLGYSDIEDKISENLLKYGNYRLSFNFDDAFNCIKDISFPKQEILLKQITNLRQKQTIAILEEVYYKAEIKLSQEQYADFLILTSSFQENLLRYLVKQLLFTDFSANKNWKESDTKKLIKEKIQSFENGQLSNYLKNYQLKNGESLKIDFDGHLSRIVLRAIIEYKPGDFVNILDELDFLEDYCDKRNNYIHNLEGVSKNIEGEKIKNTLKNILDKMTNFCNINPFNLLNEEILNQLTQTLRG